MRANFAGLRALGWVASLCVVLQTPACAQDLVFDQGRWVYRSHGLSIANPGAAAVGQGPGEEGAWQRVEAEGALLTFRGPGGATLSMIRQCSGARGDARVLARLLLIGLEDRQILSQGPVEVAGGPGWRQAVSATVEGRAVQLVSVTRPLGECSLDWVLVTQGDPAPLEGDFDAWWASFRMDAPAKAEAAESTPVPQRAAAPGNASPGVTVPGAETPR